MRACEIAMGGITAYDAQSCDPQIVARLLVANLQIERNDQVGG